MANQKIVQFRQAGNGIQESLIQRLLDKGKRYGLEEIFPIDTDQISVAQWVNLKCRYGCNRYATNWCCPPATPGPSEVGKILAEYSTALLLKGNQHCPEFYRDNAKKRARQVHCWKGTVSIERMLFLEGYYKAFSLVGECCALCKECAYPEPCRFPQEKRPSVESFSIDVLGMLDTLGIDTKLASDKNDTFSYYAIILLE